MNDNKSFDSGESDDDVVSIQSVSEYVYDEIYDFYDISAMHYVDSDDALRNHAEATMKYIIDIIVPELKRVVENNQKFVVKLVKNSDLSDYAKVIELKSAVEYLHKDMFELRKIEKKMSIIENVKKADEEIGE